MQASDMMIRAHPQPGTAGGAFNYSNDKSKGLSTFIDLNGDGLPDKVYRSGNSVYYRPQIHDSESGEISYGEPIKVKKESPVFNS